MKDKIIDNYLTEGQFTGEFTVDQIKETEFNGKSYVHESIVYINEKKFPGVKITNPALYFEHVEVLEKSYNKFLFSCKMQKDSDEYKIIKAFIEFYIKKVGRHPFEEMTQNSDTISMKFWCNCNNQIKVTQILKYACVTFDKITSSGYGECRPVLHLKKYAIEKESIFVSML